MKTKLPTTLTLLLVIFLVLAGCTAGGSSPTSTQPASPAVDLDTNSPFVTVVDGQFILGGKPYRFVGANFWQGMNLGVDGPEGNRALLLADLDQLQQLGVTNLRVMASSEGPNTEPYRMVPALMTSARRV